MARITRKDRKMIWATSLALGLALVLTAIVNEILLRATLILRTDQLIIIAVIIALFPPGMAEYVDTRWRNSVDKNIPEFLREVSEAGRTGVTLNRAVDLASQRRYGPLSE